MQTNFNLSVCKYDNPISKKYELDVNNDIIRVENNNPTNGTAKSYLVESIKDLFEQRKNQNFSNMAISYGVINGSGGDLITSDRFRSDPYKFKNAVLRICKNKADALENETGINNISYFKYSSEASLFMIDVDNSNYNISEIKETINSFAPKIWDAPYFYLPSTSSCIKNLVDPSKSIGVKGLRICIVVENGTEIPEAAKKLFYLTYADHGFIEISTNGSLLERGIIDLAVYRPNALDYICPQLGKNLERNMDLFNANSSVNNSDAKPYDLAKIKLTSHARNKIFERIKNDKKELESQAKQIRRNWANSRAIEDLKKDNPNFDEHTPQNKLTIDKVAKANIACLEDNVMTGDKIIFFSDDSTITVKEILNFTEEEKEEYNGKLCLDPDEPNYKNRKVVAKLFLKSEPPYISSFAHGHHRKYLKLENIVIKIDNHKKPSLYANEILQAISKRKDLYRRVIGNGDDLFIQVVNNYYEKILEQNQLEYIINKNLTIKDKDNWEIDVSSDLMRNIWSVDRSCFKPLSSVIDHPILKPTFNEKGKLINLEIVDTPQYDKITGLLIVENEKFYPIIKTPTDKQLRECWETLYYPFSKYEFEKEHENLYKSVLISFIISCTYRRVIDKSPSYSWTSNSPASGKSLIQECGSVIVGSHKTNFQNMPDTKQELDKIRDVSFLQNDTLVILDNGKNGEEIDPNTFNNLTSDITSDYITVRPYYSQSKVQAKNNLIYCISANRLEIHEDLCSRILNCVISPNAAEPETIKYSFNPVTEVKINRQKIISSILTLTYAMFNDKSFKKLDTVLRDGVFNKWNSLVKDTIDYVNYKFPDIGLEDICMIAKVNKENDSNMNNNLNFMKKLEKLIGTSNSYDGFRYSNSFCPSDLAIFVQTLQKDKKITHSNYDNNNNLLQVITIENLQNTKEYNSLTGIGYEFSQAFSILMGNSNSTSWVKTATKKMKHLKSIIIDENGCEYQLIDAGKHRLKGISFKLKVSQNLNSDINVFS